MVVHTVALHKNITQKHYKLHCIIQQRWRVMQKHEQKKWQSSVYNIWIILLHFKITQYCTILVKLKNKLWRFKFVGRYLFSMALMLKMADRFLATRGHSLIADLYCNDQVLVHNCNVIQRISCHTPCFFTLCVSDAALTRSLERSNSYMTF